MAVPDVMMPYLPGALAAYWNAKSLPEQAEAYKVLLALGFPPSYGENEGEIRRVGDVFWSTLSEHSRQFGDA